MLSLLFMVAAVSIQRSSDFTAIFFIPIKDLEPVLHFPFLAAEFTG